jgi:hypothetical protein
LYSCILGDYYILTVVVYFTLPDLNEYEESYELNFLGLVLLSPFIESVSSEILVPFLEYKGEGSYVDMDLTLTFEWIVPGFLIVPPLLSVT